MHGDKGGIDVAKPKYQDAVLMLQMAQWGAALDLSEATNWMWSDEFVSDYDEFKRKYPRGSDGALRAAKICGWFETIGTVYKHGLLNEDLLFDWLLISGVWDRIKGYAVGVRRETGAALLYENFEAMAKANAAWAAKQISRTRRRR